MKKLPLAVVQRITDFESESGLSLPAYALEKTTLFWRFSN